MKIIVDETPVPAWIAVVEVEPDGLPMRGEFEVGNGWWIVWEFAWYGKLRP